ncbi:hypothetical protein ENSA5_13800 [Enhygromyxa salina]|uniref:TIGR02270 family protein n=1 Tax=Enhygromyxa salina TaxID=215803 RepID=A0A2S9YEU0_9BACT|nr:hypothetical protein [Enhygromyxa salina]PRQ03625.1 hypothetical protein ENSA5_13800 [Enhygromyxa salina]
MTGLIWDIQQEHLDEAEFLLEMWSNCVDSANFTLARLAAGPEERLLARVAGLLVGGQPVLERLLLPVIAEPDDDEFRTAAATLTVLEGAGLDPCEQVLAALEHADEVGQRGLVRGLALTRRTGLIDWLGRDLDALRGPALAGRLRVLAAHRVNAGPRVRGWLSAADLQVRRAAALLARHTGSPEVLRQLQTSLDATDDALRGAAIDSGIIRGVSSAWARACSEAFGPPHPSQRSALAWVALIGDGAAHQRLLTELAHAPTPNLVWAAGLSGQPAAVDGVLALLDHPELARPAGEVVCAVAGLPATQDQYWLDRGAAIGDDRDDALPELEDDDLDTDLVPTGDDALRLPNPDAIRFWWSQRRDHFVPGVRHLSGRPLDIAQFARSLRELPTRRRHPLALELAARSTGRAQIATRATSATQHAQTQDVFARLAFLDFQRGLPLAH